MIINFAMLFVIFVKGVIWPFLVFWIVFYLRKNISDLIDNISKLRISGFEFGVNRKEEQIKNHISLKNEKLINKDDSEHGQKITDEYVEKTHTKYKNTNKYNINSLIEEIAVKDVIIDFERIYNLIFYSQISLLKHLSRLGSKGATRLNIQEFWNIVKNNPVFKDWNLETYLSFLIRNKLIEYLNSENIKITNFGLGFIIYITNMRYQKNKDL